jgi:NFU1 iron-sulfur cluster scaffold homolog, mitochondrial
MMSTDEIKITGNVQPETPHLCEFTVDRPIYEGGSAPFRSAEEADGSPLAEKLFAIEHVTNVIISGDRVTVAKSGDDAWPAFGKRVAEAIRDHITSGASAVSEQIDTAVKASGGMRAKIERLFDEKINPAVAEHGGYIELVDVRENRVFLKMSGGCQGCGMAAMTLRQGIETMLREEIPEIKEILDVTDHASGNNPYFVPSS